MMGYCGAKAICSKIKCDDSRRNLFRFRSILGREKTKGREGKEREEKRREEGPLLVEDGETFPHLYPFTYEYSDDTRKR